MNAQNATPAVKKETKNKIRVEFDRTPLRERLKAKFLNGYTAGKLVVYIFRLILLIGISYVILYPFLTQIAGSFMGISDFSDQTVRLIPKTFTLEKYRGILTEINFFAAFTNTFFLSTAMALVQTFFCALIGYGLAKFPFRGNKIVFLLVVLTMIIPHGTLYSAMIISFRKFDIYGLIGLLSKMGIVSESLKDGFNLLNTFWPLLILSATGLAFKNGLYIFMLRQFYRGIPDELEESAYLDGSNTFRTFLTIIIPLSIPMLITVFLFAFSWQWTDTFYSGMFFPSSSKTPLLTALIKNSIIPRSLEKMYYGSRGWEVYQASIINTCGLLVILPLVILYVFLQNFLVQGIERSGITG